MILRGAANAWPAMNWTLKTLQNACGHAPLEHNCTGGGIKVEHRKNIHNWSLEAAGLNDAERAQIKTVGGLLCLMKDTRITREVHTLRSLLVSKTCAVLFTC